MRRVLRSTVIAVGLALALQGALPAGAGASTAGSIAPVAPAPARAVGNGSDTAAHFLASRAVRSGVRPAFTLTAAPYEIAEADFNGDGKLDMAVLESSGYDIFLGKGDGTFQPVTFHPVGTPNLGSMVTADFNVDGKPDLAFFDWGSGPNQVIVLLGNGDGTFRSASSYPTGSSMYLSLSVGDLNGDGKPDLLETASHLALLSNGDGTFTPVSAANYLNGDASKLVDLNGDGKADLVVTSESSSPTSLEIHLGNGDGTFNPTPAITVATGLGCEPMVGDFNGDGRPDVAFCQISGSTRQLGVMLNNGGGSFSPPAYFPWPAGLGAGHRTAVADIDHDGHLDLLVAETLPPSSPAGYAVFFGNGAGQFTGSPRQTFADTTVEATDVALADLNGDGLPDLMAVFAGDRAVEVYLAAHYRYFTWYDKASPGMWNDNVHLVNPGTVTAYGDVSLPGATPMSFALPAGQETFISFPPGTIGGPVLVESSLHLVASQRVEYYNSFNEVSSIPIGAATSDLVFSWYDHASPGMAGDNIHIVNPGASTAAGTVSLGSASQPFSIPAGGETYVNFPTGSIGGPVLVHVTSGPGVLASQRVQYYGTFNEVIGQPPSAAATESYFTWFDNASPGMWNDNVHIVNPAASGTAAGTVSVPGQSVSFSVPAGGERIVTLPAGTITGPVHLLVTTGPAVLASQRVQYYQSFNEVLAAAPARATPTIYFNWFDKASPGMTNDNVHIVNPASSGTAAGTVTVGTGTAALSAPFSVGAGGETFVSFSAGTIGGPVVVHVASGPPVVASQRAQYYQTFNEVPGTT